MRFRDSLVSAARLTDNHGDADIGSMWDRRTYIAFICVGVLVRWSYRRLVLNAAGGEVFGLGAFITLWVPTAVLLGLLISVLAPKAVRSLARRGRRER